MTISALVRHFEQQPLFRIAFSPARKIWRWAFGIRCYFIAYRELSARATLVLDCPDLNRLPYVREAGQTRGKVQVMHNGIRIEKGCYYNRGCIPLFRRTHGVHEPQEEIAFATVLPQLPPDATMLELGSYWAFYSIWFARDVPGGRCHLVEPVPANLDLGARNFRLNGLTPASVTRGFVAEKPSRTAEGVDIITVDQLAAKLPLHHIHLLHADIQASERAMLDGARQMIAHGQIDYFFVSTHGDALHASCRNFLTEHHYDLLMDLPQSQCFSVDGILVARRRGLTGPTKISVSARESRLLD